ncbi:MAG: hypothetical protein RSC79_07790 [Anaerorhabdus sp.]|uniref:hypothetical protein n=1 Tax=Anaerorhabdus sp. TaxID=1872524 RepID=UPI002FC86410
MRIVILVSIIISFGLGILKLLNIISYDLFLNFFSLFSLIISGYCLLKCYEQKRKNIFVIVLIITIFQFVIFLMTI